MFLHFSVRMQNYLLASIIVYIDKLFTLNALDTRTTYNLQSPSIIK